MEQPDFHYNLVAKSDDPGQVTSLIAYQVSADRPLQAVMWSARRKEWIYAPAIAADILFDLKTMDQTRLIDRRTAEQLATEALRTTLPSETTLQEMCDHGARMGWRFGPPRE